MSSLTAKAYLFICLFVIFLPGPAAESSLTSCTTARYTFPKGQIYFYFFPLLSTPFKEIMSQV